MLKNYFDKRVDFATLPIFAVLFFVSEYSPKTKIYCISNDL